MASFAMLQFNHTTTAEAEAAPPKIIAKFDKISNGFIINEDILRKTFVKGGKIERFSIQKDKDGIFLIRRGIDHKKMHRTEAIKLQAVQKGGLKLILDFKLKWYTVCTSGSCWCLKVKDSCDCAEGGNCFFGQLPIGAGDDIEVIVLG
jgi:hypothetical protein